MASVRFEITGLDQLARMREALSPQMLAKATRAGVTAAAKAVPGTVAKGVSERYGLPSRRVRQDLRAARVAPDGQSATVAFSRRPPTLAQFGARPGRPASGQPGLGRGLGWGKPTKPGRPLSALVVRADGRQPVAGAFLATGRSGNRLVLRRGRGGKLEALYGPSVGSIFAGASTGGPALRAETETVIRARFIAAFQRTLDSAARGYGRG
jgi:hypothetical protein